jgi:hypothetical protein
MRKLLAFVLIIVSLLIVQPSQAVTCGLIYPAGVTQISFDGGVWVNANPRGLPALQALVGCTTGFPRNRWERTYYQIRVNGVAYPSYISGDKVVVLVGNALYVVSLDAWWDAAVLLGNISAPH